MSCDATTTDELIIGDDWVWSYTTTDDVSGWTSPVIQVRSGFSATDDNLIASNVGVGATIVTAGGFSGEVPATSFADGVFTWFVPKSVTSTVAANFVYVEAEVLVNGVATTVYPARAYKVQPQLAVRP